MGCALAAEAGRRGWSVAGWDRHACPPDAPDRMDDYVAAVAPDAILHAAVPSTGTGRPDEGRLVNVEWTTALARIAMTRRLDFTYVSSVMVFTDKAAGPFDPWSQPDAPEGYGFEKRQGERTALHTHPGARVVRLGWQIGDRPEGNNMIAFFAQKMREQGRITASRRWYPACSFLADTAAAMCDSFALPPGLYQVNGNTQWTFFDIATALNRLHGGSWVVEATDDFVYDQRMRDPRLATAPLNQRLPGLP